MQPKEANGLAAATTKDDYLTRLVKYIPSEIVGLYAAAAGVVPKVEDKPDPAIWWVFVGCAVATPIYLFIATKDTPKKKGPLWVQVTLGTIAFPVWVFAMGGPFVLLPWYASKQWIASLVLLFVTFSFGRVEPRPGS
jgi:hypothetical protein